MNDDRTQVDRTVPYRAEVTVASTPSTIGESRLPRPLAIGQRWGTSDGADAYTIVAGPVWSAWHGANQWEIRWDTVEVLGDDGLYPWWLLGEHDGDVYLGTTAEAHATLQQVTNTTPHEVWGEDAGL